MNDTQFHPIITNHKVLMLGGMEFERDLLHDYLEIHLDQQYIQSLGIDFGVTHLGFLGENYKFLIYQLSSDPKFTYLLKKFLPGSKAIILPFRQIDQRLMKQLKSIVKLVDQLTELDSLRIILFQENVTQTGKFINEVQNFIKQLEKDYDTKITIFQKDPNFINSLELALHFILNDLHTT